MLTFRQYLLEFDPNRGALGRAKPIIPHIPSPDELRVADKTTPNLKGLKQSNLQKRMASLNPTDSQRLAAFAAGKQGHRWQGTGQETRDQFDSQMVAHEAGRKITLPREGAKIPLKSRISTNLTTNTPAANLQRSVEKQEDTIRANRPNAMFDVRGYRR